MGLSCMAKGPHFNDHLLCCVDLDHLLCADLLMAFPTKNDMDIRGQLDGTRVREIRFELGSILPVKREPCPREFGELALALEFPPEYRK